MSSVLNLRPKKSSFTSARARTDARRCPLVRYRACWCRGICEPIAGVGQCGHLAPHSLQGRTQRAIAERNAGLVVLSQHRRGGQTRRD